MAAGFEMRVSDTEREAAAAELREHFASGRLTQEELGERLDTALTAKTRGDLSALFNDLPSAPPGMRAGTGAWAEPGTGAWTGAGDRGQYQDQAPGGQDFRDHGGWHAGPGRTAGRMAAAFAAVLLVLPVLVLLGALSVFGIRAGRPVGIVLIIAALAVLRRLLLVIFGRRRGCGRGRGPRRRRW